jgi:DNA-binding SARP family transcriptional activator
MPEFRILGPIEVRDDGAEVRLTQRSRSLLALLLLRANRVVPTEFLIDRLWGEQPPRTAITSLQNTISQLRRLLPADMLETRMPGYVLHVQPNQLDLERFERLVQKARGEPPAERAGMLREALALWRGDPLAELTFEPCVADEIRDLSERRLQAIEERLDADLELGRHTEVVAELETLVAQEESRERLLGQLMLALYKSGRNADANDQYQAYRVRIDEQRGLIPGRALQELHRAILRHDPALQPTTNRAPAGDIYSHVVRAMLASRLVPVLGPGVSRPAPAASAPDPAAAAAHLARTFECPPDRAGNLTRVSQYVAVTHGIGALYDELHTLYGGDYEPGLVHRALVSFAPILRASGLHHQVIVTTSYDRTLERAFAAAGEEVDVVSYVALGRNRGKFVHLAPDGRARVIDEPNTEVGLTTADRTIVLKIHGGSALAPDAEADSYVVSEDDYIDYLSHTRLSALLPVGLAAKLSRSHFLFLGYDLDDWSLRVFLRRLWGEERVGYRSWAVGPTADPLTTEYWKQCGVDAFDAPLNDFVEGLHTLLEQGQ